jgi:8-oxo-dGTP pyrophosphatase MutT (NUDIX family)
MTKKYQHFGIYALIFDKNKQNILLIKKSRGPYTGMLDLPGGSPEDNETPKETLIREVKEETGAEIDQAQSMGYFETKLKYVEDQQQCLLTHTGEIFITVLKGNVFIDLISSDTNGCVWVNIDNLSNVNITPSVLESLKMYSNKKYELCSFLL